MPEPGPRRFAESRQHLVRWRGPGNPKRAPTDLEVVVGSRWVKAGLLLRRHLWRPDREVVEPDRAERLLSEACSGAQPEDDASSPALRRLRVSWLRFLISPPLRLGAPRSLSAEATKEPEESLKGRLPERVEPAVKEQAEAGWQRARERHAGIEQRSQAFLQAAGLTTTLLLANSVFIEGDSKLEGLQQTAVIAGLVFASLALVACGIYGLFGAMYTFDRVAPNDIDRVIERATLEEPEEAARAYVAVVLLAARRTALVADWKLARLKRARWCLILVVVGVLTASFGLFLGG